MKWQGLTNMFIINLLRTVLVQLPRTHKRIALISFDFVGLGMAIWLSYCLRYSAIFIPDIRQLLLIFAGPVIAIPIFIRMGLYRAVIRYMPERAIWTMLQAMSLAALGWVTLVFVAELAGRGVVPRSVPFLYWLVGGLVVVGSRFAAKYLIWAPRDDQLHEGQILIYGAGDAGVQLAAAMRAQGRRLIAGFLDDDASLHGRDVAGIRVYDPEYFPTLVANFGIREVILSIPSVAGERRREIVQKLTGHSVKIRTLPPISDLLSGNYMVNQIREIDIDELLGRSSVPADQNLLSGMIEGRSILVTGAGGSIGSELCRLVLEWKPRQVVLYEQNEFALYNIDRALKALNVRNVKAVLASVTDEHRLRRTMLENQVDVVFHAAAHKHVPLVEANVFEGVRNNVFGSLTTTRVAYECGVKNFVLISSDKAVRPTNVMGATKRWAELIVHDYALRAAQAGSGQKFCAVRFGNVLGSNGSVVPLFKEQIVAGGPVTITDERMTRYFMSIHEAAELIVQAGALSHGGDIFLLEMGSPILIKDLAKNMIQLAGHKVRDAENPEGSIEITTVGARPGEKMFEELFYDATSAEPTKHSKILRTGGYVEGSELLEGLSQLQEHTQNHDEDALRRVLFAMIGRFAESKSPARSTLVASTSASPHG